MLRSYPHLSAATVSFASLSTVLKSGLTVGYYLLILVGILAFARKSIVERFRTSPMHHKKGV